MGYPGSAVPGKCVADSHSRRAEVCHHGLQTPEGHPGARKLHGADSTPRCVVFVAMGLLGRSDKGKTPCSPRLFGSVLGVQGCPNTGAGVWPTLHLAV